MKSAILAVVIAAAVFFAGCASSPLHEGVGADGRAYRGNGNATLTIYEYSDFECPYCGEVQPTLDGVMHQYADRVKLEYRYYPLPIHPDAMNASLAGVCADRQGKFWEMYDKMFSNQGALAASDLSNYANQIGLNASQFQSCFASQGANASVQQDINEGNSIGVQATPTFVIGETTIKGAQSSDVFKSAIDNELAKLQ